MARRSRVDIVIDVLDALASEGALPPTRLATLANLPYDRLSRILDDLESRGLVTVDEGERGKLVAITRKGFEALQELRRFKRLLKDLGLA